MQSCRSPTLTMPPLPLDHFVPNANGAAFVLV